MNKDVNKSEEEIKEIEQKIESLQKKRNDLHYEKYGYPEPDYDDFEEPESSEFEIDYISTEIETLENKKEDLERKEAQKRQIINNNQIYETRKAQFKKGNIKVDSETKEDELDRTIYANVIAKYIVNKKTETPFNIGIFGEWGEGKSSFLKIIEKEIIDCNNDLKNENYYKTNIVKYDATEYSEKDKIWACILKKMFEKFEEEKGVIGRLQFFWNRFYKNSKNNKIKYWINFIAFVCTIILGYKTIKFSSIKESWGYIVLGIVPFIMTIINIVIPAIKGQLKISMSISEVISKNMELPNYDKELGKKESLREDLINIEQVWLKNNERIVIFIDELDRCSEKAIFELLEALQLFLKSEKIIIVMAVDIIATSKILYKDKSDQLKLTVDYLEKYISLPIYLKEINNYKSYIDFLLDKKIDDKKSNIINSSNITTKHNIIDHTEISDNKFSFTEEEENLIKDIISEMNIRNHITPRRVKRILNILNISKQMCIELSEIRNYEEKILFENYIKWFFFSYFNPEIAFILEDNTKYTKYKNYATIKEIKEIKEIKKGERQNKEFDWLDRYINDITKDQLQAIKEISRLFIMCDKISN